MHLKPNENRFSSAEFLQFALYNKKSSLWLKCYCASIFVHLEPALVSGFKLVRLKFFPPADEYFNWTNFLNVSSLEQLYEWSYFLPLFGTELIPFSVIFCSSVEDFNYLSGLSWEKLHCSSFENIVLQQRKCLHVEIFDKDSFICHPTSLVEWY